MIFLQAINWEPTITMETPVIKQLSDTLWHQRPTVQASWHLTAQQKQPYPPLEIRQPLAAASLCSVKPFVHVRQQLMFTLHSCQPTNTAMLDKTKVLDEQQDMVHSAGWCKTLAHDRLPRDATELGQYMKYAASSTSPPRPAALAVRAHRSQKKPECGRGCAYTLCCCGD